MYMVNKNYGFELVPEAQRIKGGAAGDAAAQCSPAARAPANRLPAHLSAEAVAFLSSDMAYRRRPVPAGAPEAAAAELRARAAALGAAAAEKHVAAFVQDLTDSHLGGVPVVISSPNPGLAADGRPAAGGGGGAAGVTDAVSRGAILHFHGGAYFLGSPRSMAQAYAPLSAVTGLTAVSVDYRLAPEHPFPAALDDAAAAYRALLETHDASRVAISGDSAGGGLAAALLLRAASEGLPLPAAAVLFSPWALLNATHADTASTLRCVDPYLTLAILDLGAGWYASGSRLGLNDPLVSPALADWSRVKDSGGEGGGGGRAPAVRIFAGTREMLLSDAAALQRAMARGGLDAGLSVYDGMWHVWASGGPGALAIPEAAEAMQEAGDFISKHIPREAPAT